MAALGSQRASGRLLAALDEVDLRALSRSLSDDLRERKVTFGAADGGSMEAFVVDPVPRVIERDEWDALATGLAQRAGRSSASSPTSTASAGSSPPVACRCRRSRAPSSSSRGWRSCRRPRGAGSRSPVWTSYATATVPFAVLEDNVRTPSGIAYAVAAREALSGHLSVPDGMRVRSLEPAYEWLGEALRAAAPPRGGRAPVGRRAHRRAVELGLLRARRDRPPTRAAARAPRGPERALRSAVRAHRRRDRAGRRRLSAHGRGSPLRCRRSAHRPR